MQRKLLFAALCAAFVLSGQLRAQTDVTSTYLTNADFSQTTALTATYLYGYGKDGSPYGFQAIDGWTSVVTSGDNSNNSYPNSGTAAGVFSYGSSTQLKGNSKAAPATNPSGEASGNCFGFFGVWGCGGYYYQNVTLAPGKYTITVPMYNQSGTQANTTYTGFFPTSGTNKTVAVNPTVGQWVNQTVTFTLTAETAGQIRIGYQSTGSGSGSNPMLFIDCVKIEYTAAVVKDVLETALTAATNANATLNSSDLTSAIATAQSVYNNEDATQEQVNSAAATLNAATELAMSAAGDVTGIFLSNPGFESCTAETSDVAAITKKDYSSAGWTNTSTGSYTTIAVTAYGGGVKVANSTTPSTKKDGTTVSGNTLGVIAGWGDNVIIQSGDVTLPAGVYTLTVDHYLTSTTSNYDSSSSKFGFVTSGNSYLVSSTTFAASTWTTETVTFTLTEAATGKLQIGLTGLNKSGSGSPAIFYDDITITYQSFLAGAKAAWDDAVADAEQAKTECENVTGEELTALDEELAKAEPTTVEGYNDATEALEAATATFTAAKDAYDAYANFLTDYLPENELDYATTEKYTAIGDAYNGEGDVVDAADATARVAAALTALRAYYESHALAEKVDGAVDCADAISGADPDTNTGWTGGIGTDARSWEMYTDASGNAGGKYYDGGWSQTAGVNINMSREISLPAGTYLLTVTARGSESLTSYTMSVAGESVALPKNGSGEKVGVFGHGWDDVSVEFTSDGHPVTLTIAATSTEYQQWISFNRFRLMRLELYSDAYAGAEDYDALNDAIETAETKTLGFENGEFAPYNNVAALEALAAAKAIDQTAELTNVKTDVQAATTALTGATWTANTSDVDAIYNGSFAEANGYNPKGWTRSNNAWGQQITDLTTETNGVNEGTTTAWYYNTEGAWEYGKDGYYTMPLAANQTYKLTFKYRSHANGSNNWMKVSVLNDSNEGLDETEFPKHADATVFVPCVAFFKTGAAGNYNLSIKQSGNTHLTDVSLVKAEATDIVLGNTLPTNYTFYQSLTLGDRTFSNENWNTLCVPFAFDAEDFAAVKELSAITVNGESVIMSFADATTIEAGKPYLVKAKNNYDELTATNVTLPGADIQESSATADGYTVNYVGTYAGTALNATDNDNAYVVKNSMLYNVTSDVNVGAYRAYFTLTGPSEVKALTFDFDGSATAISEIVNGTSSNGKWYNLAGQRVNKAQKGIYIVNGKKVLVNK